MPLIALHLPEVDVDVVDPLRRVLERTVADGGSAHREDGIQVVSASPEARERFEHADVFETCERLRLTNGAPTGEVLADAIDAAVGACSPRTTALLAGRPIVAIVPILAAETMPTEAIDELNRWVERAASHLRSRRDDGAGPLPEADDIRRLPWICLDKAPEVWPDALFEQTERLSSPQRTPIYHRMGRAEGERRGWSYMAEQLETELTALASLSSDRNRLKRAFPALSGGAGAPDRVHRVHSARLEIPLHTRVALDVLTDLAGADGGAPDAASLPEPDDVEAEAKRDDISFGDDVPRLVGATTSIEPSDYHLPDGPKCPLPAELADQLRRLGPNAPDREDGWPTLLDRHWSPDLPGARASRLRADVAEALSDAYDALLPVWIDEELERLDARVWGDGASDETPEVDRIESELRRALEEASSTRQGISRVFSLLGSIREELSPRARDGSADTDRTASSDGGFDPVETLPDDWAERERELLERGRRLPSRDDLLLQHAALLVLAAIAGFLTASTLLGPVLSAVLGFAAVGGLQWRRRRELQRYFGESCEEPRREAPDSWAAQREAWLEAINRRGIEPVLETLEHRLEHARRGALDDLRVRLDALASRLRTDLEGLARLADERRRLLQSRLDRIEEADPRAFEATSFLPLDVGETEAPLDAETLFETLVDLWEGVFDLHRPPEPVGSARYAKVLDTLVDRGIDGLLVPTPRHLGSHLERFVGFVAGGADFPDDTEARAVERVVGERLVFGGHDDSMRRWEATPESLVARSQPHATDVDDRIAAPSESPLGPTDLAWGCRVRTVHLDRGRRGDEEQAAPAPSAQREKQPK